MMALRRALVDLAAGVRDLKITGVAKSAAMAAEGAQFDGVSEGKGRDQFYYDVTVLKHPSKDQSFGPIIIDALRESYEDIMEVSAHWWVVIALE